MSLEEVTKQRDALAKDLVELALVVDALRPYITVSIGGISDAMVLYAMVDDIKKHFIKDNKDGKEA